MKTCSRCREALPLVQFHQKGGGYRRPECKACFKIGRPRVSAAVRKAAALSAKVDSPGYQRFYKYGVTPDDYHAMLQQQAGTCAICGSTNPAAPDWQVDHDHETGRVRGLLCRPCNIALGLMCDDVDRMRRAIAYLRGSADG